MDEMLRKKVEKVLDGENIGYAYVCKNDGSKREEYVFQMTPKNIANFIGSNVLGVRQMILTDLVDQMILDTCGNYINRCPNQELCMEILKHLIPIQMGEREAEDILMVTREEFDAYGQWEEEQVTMAEMSMM